jgi:hypothetical protein
MVRLFGLVLYVINLPRKPPSSTMAIRVKVEEITIQKYTLTLKQCIASFSGKFWYQYLISHLISHLGLSV